MKVSKWMAALAATLVLGVVGCEQKGPAEQAGEKIDQTMENAGDKASDAMDTAGKKMEDAGEAVQEHAQ